jgi:release factor glutamine methyltransferase
MPETVPTVEAVLGWAVQCLADAGIPSPRREAHTIWRVISDRSAVEVWFGRGSDAAGDEVSRFREAVRRRSDGEPIAYACGTVGFRHLTLRADRRALIPRPESEGLIDLALRAQPRGAALDLGTGSGCLALALADEGDYDSIVGIDRSAEAIALARENGSMLGLEVEWQLGIWGRPVAGRRFDLVVSNPPYLTTGEVASVDPSVGHYEPALALDGGQDGLRATAELLTDVSAILSLGGHLVLELDARRAEETAAILPADQWETITITEDLFGRSRYLTARRGKTSHD